MKRRSIVLGIPALAMVCGGCQKEEATLSPLVSEGYADPSIARGSKALNSAKIAEFGRDNTLPLEIWGRLRRGITPEINAVSILICAASVALIVASYGLRNRVEHTSS